MSGLPPLSIAYNSKLVQAPSPGDAINRSGYWIGQAFKVVAFKVEPVEGCGGECTGEWIVTATLEQVGDVVFHWFPELGNQTVGPHHRAACGQAYDGVSHRSADDAWQVTCPECKLTFGARK